MKRLKKFLVYALLVVALWIFSDIIIYVSINSTYANVNTKVYVNSPEIIIGESKATYVNGIIKGKIKNNTNEIINNKYLKIDLYSARDVMLGTKYIKLDNVKINEYKDFEMWYKFTDVDYATVTVTDNANNATEEEFLSQETNLALVIGTLIALYCVLPA